MIASKRCGPADSSGAVARVCNGTQSGRGFFDSAQAWSWSRGVDRLVAKDERADLASAPDDALLLL